MNTKNVHSVCVVGAAADLTERISALLAEQFQRLDAIWRSADQASADLLLIDPDSVYGHMDWLRAQSSGRHIIACTHTPEAYAGAPHLRKPISANEFVVVLNRLGALLDAQPKAPTAATPPPAPIAAAPTPPAPPAAARPAKPAPPIEAPEPPPAPPPLRDPQLLDLLGPDSPLPGKTCLVAPGLPSVFIDPRAGQWHADASLKALAGWCTRTLTRADLRAMSEAEFASAVATLPSQPHARLTWLAHLTRGAGQLDPGLDAHGRFKLARWPQSEREFPKHFRIATVMLKQAAPIDDIVALSGATASDVADFINAYHALGFVEHDGPEKTVDEGRRGGLFGRVRKISSN